MSKAKQQPRIEPLDPPYDGEIAGVLEKMMPPGVPPLKLFRTIARNKEVLNNFAANGRLIYANSSLSKLEREIIIQRVCAACGSEYEWGVHASFFGQKVGLTGDRLRAIVSGAADDPVWSERESLLIRMVDELHRDSTVSDELWESLAAHWSAEQLIEAVVIAGFYHTVSYVTRALGIELEDFGERFSSYE
jgi:4-carboxymuconolactone decarboxylase